MEAHRLLTFIGVALLLATLAVYYGGWQDSVIIYVTGIAMICAFGASFALFNKDRWDSR